MNREYKMQCLLRRAFVCAEGKSCSCADNIKEFLLTDKKSKEWATKEMVKMRKQDFTNQ